MKIFKPTLPKLALSAIMIVALVPLVQLTQPGCAEFAKLPHGDGAPTVCLDGSRTLLSYAILAAKGGRDINHSESWNWPLHSALNYEYLVLGSILAYSAACTIMFYGGKLKPEKKRSATKSVPEA